MIFHIIHYNPDLRMLAIHTNKGFLRMHVTDGEWDTIVEGLKGTIFEGKAGMLKTYLATYFPLTMQEQFHEAQAIIRENGPKSTADFAMLLPGIDQIATHPTTKNQNVLYYIIMDLNDRERWTRSQIADWIESLDADVRF